MIELLVVDDSSFIRRIIRDILASESMIKIVGEAADGKEAMSKIRELDPDVVLLDIVMSMPDGLWVVEQINAQHPTPVIIFSAIASNASEVADDALKLGVVGIVHKPRDTHSLHKVKQELIEKIKAAALLDKARLADDYRVRGFETRVLAPHRIIVIGSSAGGPPALRELVHALPSDLAAGILIGQHIPEGFVESLIVHLREVCEMSVKMAEDGDIVTYGRILVSPVARTLTVHRLKRGGVVRLVDVESRPRPSIDVMFESAAGAYGRNCCGVVLSGMGSDGTRGLQAIKAAGGRVFVQDDKTALAWGMPQSALESGVACRGMSVPEIAQELLKC